MNGSFPESRETHVARAAESPGPEAAALSVTTPEDLAALELGFEALRRLAGNVAHDFNNFLTAILGYGEFALLEVGAEHPARNDVVEMVAAARRASALTRKLVGFSKGEPAGGRVADVVEVASMTAARLRAALPPGVELRVVVPKSPAVANADPLQLETALAHLATNALEAMPGGGVLTIEVEHERASGPAAREGTPAPPGAPEGAVAIVVSDTGVGMTPEIHARLFEPLFTTKGKREGRGFGLASVYGIVRCWRGTITCTSTPGRGARFRLLLPPAPHDLMPARPARTASPAEAAELLHARRPGLSRGVTGAVTILLVDDEERVRRMAAQVLAAAGYDVLEASSIAEALARASEAERPIHLLVTDLALGGESGRDLAQAFRAAHRAMRVVFLSGWLPGGAPGAAIPANECFLPKPFAPGELLAKVREALGGATSAAA